MALLFTGIIAFYSVTALTVSRRDEFATWRLVGATRKQLVHLVLAQVLHTTLVALALGTVIAFASVLAIGAGLGQWPSGSPFLLIIVVVTTVGLACLAAVTSALRATHRHQKTSRDAGITG